MSTRTRADTSTKARQDKTRYGTSSQVCGECSVPLGLDPSLSSCLSIDQWIDQSISCSVVVNLCRRRRRGRRRRLSVEIHVSVDYYRWLPKIVGDGLYQS